MKRGFSLIEIILYFAIIGLVLSSVFFYLGMVQSAKNKNQAVLEVEQQGELILSEISRSISKASVINYPVFGSSSSTLSVAMASSTLNPTIFYLSSTTLMMSEGGINYNLNADLVSVSDLNFKNLGNEVSDSIRVTFRINYKNISGTNDYEYNKNFSQTISK